MTHPRSLFRFEIQGSLEPFFALQTLTDENSRIHAGWKMAALSRIPQSFHRKFALVGGSPFLWPAVADSVLPTGAESAFDQTIARFAALRPDRLQQVIFFGIFHDREAVASLLSGQHDLFQTIMRIPKTKREWLAFLGLYPAKKNSPFFRGLDSLLRTPKQFQQIVANMLEIFWESDFKQTWNDLVLQMERSRDEKERLFESCTLDEFARLALLRVEINEARGFLQAVRGGYKLALNRLSKVLLFPSAFNDKRHWTTYEEPDKKTIAYFPYFDPAISLTRLSSNPSERGPAEPEIDPALIFKALGDTTRYGMTAMLAREPMTSADLAVKMALSRPTISHHIHVLREAGLLEEKLQGNSVLLSVKREPLETLSDLVTRQLFYSREKIDLKKSRTK